MKKILLVLSPVATVMGGLLLASTLSNPSLDAFVLARDLGLSIAAMSTGVAAPLLSRKFSEDE